jgi:hypothetical protein
MIAREVSSVLDCGASMIRTASRNIFFAKENPEISEVSEVVNPVNPFDCRELVAVLNVARTMLRIGTANEASHTLLTEEVAELELCLTERVH